MRAVVFVGALLATACAAHAQYGTGYEPPTYAGNASGVVLSGQNSWYQPVVGGLDHHVFTYAGNTHGFVQNPTGGEHFIAGVSGGGSLFPRAQINHNFTAGTWTLAYDMAGMFTGQPPSALNLSSFSLQHDTVPANQFKQFIALNNFIDLANPGLGWKAEFNVFSSTGLALNNQSPGVAWANLQVNQWYRQAITIDLASNQVLSITLTNLHTNASETVNPPDWYMTGGPNSTLALPNGVRFFVGGAAGNTMGWDNLDIIPAPGTAALLGLGLLAARRRR